MKFDEPIIANFIKLTINNTSMPRKTIIHYVLIKGLKDEKQEKSGRKNLRNNFLKWNYT